MFWFDVCGSVHLGNMCFYSIPTGCTNIWLYTAVVLLVMDATASEICRAYKYFKKEIKHILALSLLMSYIYHVPHR
jgi:hypothetical protein